MGEQVHIGNRILYSSHTLLFEKVRQSVRKTLVFIVSHCNVDLLPASGADSGASPVCGATTQPHVQRQRKPQSGSENRASMTLLCYVYDPECVLLVYDSSIVYCCEKNKRKKLLSFASALTSCFWVSLKGMTCSPKRPPGRSGKGGI